MQSLDHPELQFIQARYYGKGRPAGSPLWLVAHTMEAPETANRARSTAEYFRTMLDGRVVSSHYTADDTAIFQCVRLADTAFTVGNTLGNQRGINWEFAGFAQQSGAQWGDRYSMAMLERAAPYWAADAARYDIPIHRCSIADLLDKRPGLTSHNDLRIAFGGTTHTDPGAGFPWFDFMDMIISGNPLTDGEDENMRLYKADKPGAADEYYLSNGIHRRRINPAGTVFSDTISPLTLQEAIILTDTKRQNAGYETWDQYLDVVCGPLAPTGTAGGGVQTVVLNGTISGTVSGTISGSAGVVTDDDETTEPS